MTGKAQGKHPLKIYLAGPPYSGKTLTGSWLGELMGLPSLDLDSVIEASVGMSIPRIFRHSGEPVFRRLERLHLERLANSRENLVLSLGGGCLLDPSNLDLATSSGLVVTLLVSTKTLLERASDSPGGRPLATSIGELEALLASRETHYRELPNCLDVEGMTTEESADQVRALVQGILQTRE